MMWNDFFFFLGAKDRYIIDLVCIQRSIDPGASQGKQNITCDWS